MVRNGALMLVAVLGAVALAAEPGASAAGWLDRIDASTAAAGLAAAGIGTALLACWGMLHVLRGHGRLLNRIDQLEAALERAGIEVPRFEDDGGLPVGSSAPRFDFPSVDGSSLELDGLVAAGRPLLVVFTDSACVPCHELLPEISRWQVEDQETLTIAVAASGPVAEVRQSAGEHELENVLLDTDGELFERYQAAATPSAVLIDADATVASPIAAGPEQIRSLRWRAIGAAAQPRPPAMGEPAPRLELPLLDGGTVEIGRPGSDERLLLFWDPSCGYCRQMHSDLRRFEEGPRNGSPELLVISGGTEEATRAEGFRSQVAVDRDSRASQALGAGGTPMAVLIDDQARIASDLAAGADEVMTMARAKAATGP
jgi:methylamine dehydrogenase accessory protein MauD